MSAAFKPLCSQLRKLHALLREGKGESDEANSLRDQMDPHWNVCTKTEQEELRKLSSLLYLDSTV